MPDALDSPTDDVQEEPPRKKFKNTQPQVSHDYLDCIYESVLKWNDLWQNIKMASFYVNKTLIDLDGVKLSRCLINAT